MPDRCSYPSFFPTPFFFFSLRDLVSFNIVGIREVGIFDTKPGGASPTFFVKRIDKASYMRRRNVSHVVNSQIDIISERGQYRIGRKEV